MMNQEAQNPKMPSDILEKTSLGKLLFLAIIAMALSSFGPLLIFAPVPMIIVFLLYGRVTTFAIGGISAAILFYVSMTFKYPMPVSFLYLAAFIYAMLIAEVLMRNINPVKGLMTYGFVFLITIFSSVLIYSQVKETSIRNELQVYFTKYANDFKADKANKEFLDSPGDQARAFKDLISTPSVMANELYEVLPAMIFMTVFFGLWLSLYWTLRNYKLWRFKVFYSYSVKDLIQFKVPDFFVFPLILSLGMLVGAEFGLGKIYEVIGSNLLYCLGMLYLFQGFGIYNDLLKYLRIGGFIKTLFVVFTLVMAYKFLAIIGMFDMWIDFRKFLKNTKNDKGDIL